MPHRLVTAGYITVVIGGAWALNHASHDRSESKLQSSENTCRTVGNPGRALDRLNAVGRELELREHFQPIVDCHATYYDHAGVPVPLAPDQQRRYVEFVRRGITPVVRADGTVAPRSETSKTP